jgi:hypothetical protein
MITQSPGIEIESKASTEFTRSRACELVRDGVLLDHATECPAELIRQWEDEAESLAQGDDAMVLTSPSSGKDLSVYVARMACRHCWNDDSGLADPWTGERLKLCSRWFAADDRWFEIE